MVERLLRSRAFAGLIPERAFVGNLKQVVQFLHDTNMKERVLGRVHEYIDSATKVVVGHSLGSVVAYEYLCRERPQERADRLTLGSPLGIRNIVFDRLTPSPGDLGGAWPGQSSIRWVNVADPDDVVALRKDLAPLFPPPHGRDAIADYSVDNGDEPHEISNVSHGKGDWRCSGECFIRPIRRLPHQPFLCLPSLCRVSNRSLMANIVAGQPSRALLAFGTANYEEPIFAEMGNPDLVTASVKRSLSDVAEDLDM